MKNKLVKNLFRASLVTSSILMAVMLTAGEITSTNRGAISDALKQPTFEIINSNKDGVVDTQYYKSKYHNIGELITAGKSLIEKIEGEGAVLLKNENNALPLKTAEDKKVTLFGIASEIPCYGGRGSSHTNHPQDPTDFHEGFAAAGLQTNPKVRAIYTQEAQNFINEMTGGYSYFSIYETPFSKIEANAEAYASIEDYGTAVYVLSRTGGESNDLKIDGLNGYEETEEDREASRRNTLNLTNYEKANLAKLAQLKQQHKVKKIIVLLNTTNQIEDADFLDSYGIDATIWAGHLGITGSIGIGKLLTGEYNPSGSLPDTFYYKHSDNPVMMNFPFKSIDNMDKYAEFDDNTKLKGTEFNRYYAYQEGIYVGYRYAETRYTDVVEGRTGAGDWKYDKVISQPFGAGLSYTTFDYSDFSTVKNSDGSYTATVTVTNAGDVAGKEAVEIYLQKPYTDFDIEREIEKSAVELVGFNKTGLIQPGESEKVTVELDADVIKSYDRKVAKTYVVTPGDYLFTAARDAHEAANNFLASKGFTKAANGMTEDGNAALVTKFADVEYSDRMFNISDATGKEITNLFDQVDINNYSGKKDEAKGLESKMDFLSRSNWSKTLECKVSATQKMVEDLLRQKNSAWIEKGEGAYPTYGKNAGLQLIAMYKDADGNLIDYDNEMWETFLDQLSWEDTVELVRFGYRGTNVLPSVGKPKTNDHNGPTGLTEYYDRYKNGLATKTGDSNAHIAPVYYPSIPVVAATRSLDIAAEFGDMLGEDGLWAGYNGFYGIGLNTHRSPYAGRQFEYWSEDPFLAGTMAAEQVKKLQEHGVNAYIKHFALNDQEGQRKSVQIWSNEQALREIYLRSFEIAVTDGGAMNAMVSFTRIGIDMCTVSHSLLTDFLRGECGMKGLAVTDMYGIGYEPQQLASMIMNGIDAPDSDKIDASLFDEYKTGYPALANAMRESAHRILYSTVRSNAMNGIDSDTIVRAITPSWEKGVIAGEVITIVLFSASVIWGGVIVFFEIKNKKQKTK